MGMEKGGIGFKLGMGQRLHLSIVAFVITFILAIAVTGFSYYIAGRKDAQEVPQLALNTLLKSVLSHHQQEGRFPKDFAELEFNVWNKKQSGYKSRLYSDNNLYLVNNYLYIYVPGEQVCAIWAIPQGKFRDQANTVYLVISPDKQEMWRGAALSQAEVNSIPRTPLVKKTDMARLGMFEQKQEQETNPLPKKKGIFRR